MADIRRIVDKIEAAIGSNATAEQVERVARLFLEEIVSSRPGPHGGTGGSGASDHVIITAYGHDKPGILAGVTNTVSDYGCNILDVSQKILQGYFTLIMLADVSGAPDSAGNLQKELSSLADKLNVRIMVQHEDLFNAMHRP